MGAHPGGAADRARPVAQGASIRACRRSRHVGLHPETEISLADAQALRSGAAIGETAEIAFGADRAQLRGIVDAGSVTGWLGSDPLAALAAVEFTDLAVDIARHVVVDGEVTYPVAGPLPPPLRIEIAGFTLVISRFSIFALGGFRASASVILPPGVTDAASCGPAVIGGTGFTLDLSLTACHVRAVQHAADLPRVRCSQPRSPRQQRGCQGCRGVRASR
jgi:hypothetical protein